ncbi:MAG: nucleoside deaminase [Opitutales bacterium]
MTRDQMLAHLYAAHAEALAAMDAGRHPFGAVLVAPDGETILLRQGNRGSVCHAETELARQAARQFDPQYLWHCALVTTFEPCAMCAGTQYWAHIGTLVYGVAEAELRACTGDHAENPTMDLPCRDVFAKGQKPITVQGPFEEVRERFLAPHRSFWSATPHA